MNRHIQQIAFDIPTTDAQSDEYRRKGTKEYCATNISTRIGALHFIRDRESHHEQAAFMFKSRYEHFYGNGLGASDTGRIQVDVSKTAHDFGMAKAVDNGRELSFARDALPKPLWDAVVACVVLHSPPGDMVNDGQMSDRQLRKARRAKADEILTGLDKLCEVWNLKTRAKRKAA